MVVKIMGWRPWPPNSTRKFKVTLKVHSLEDLKNGEEINGAQNNTGNPSLMMIKVKWKGSKRGLGQRLRGSQKRARTTEKSIEHHQHGHVSIYWQEDFEHLCVLTVAKDTSFLPFDVQFNIIQVGTKSKSAIIGKAVINLGDFAPSTQDIMKHTMRLPISSSEEMQKHVATLVVSVNFSEVRLHESSSMERFMPPSLHCLSGPLLCDAQIRDMYGKKLKDMKKSVSLNWKKTSGEMDSIMCNGKLSTTSEESSSELGDLYDDTDSLDASEEDKMANGEDQILQSYGPLAGVNLFVEGALPQLTENRHVEENAILSTSSKTSSEVSINDTSTSDSDQSTTMRSLLSWKKRKLSFRGSRTRGEPLLNKAYGEDGGDDIDRDRRLSGCPVEPCCSQNDEKAILSSSISQCLDFGEELFSVGCWERKELVSRDGNMKLSTDVFFASIDQRSERAAGESACTALVAVIADWLHKNPDRIPIKAEFDTLIREGSAEWRKLCDIESYRNNFPDRHFDLDTVVNAKVRPLTVDHARSFVGFFQPEGLDDTYNFLQGAKSFDDIWIAIEETLVLKPDVSFEPAIYIVSWNDHFFILKVSKEAYYIIDTLGERLYEGCNQAYILRFDTEASLCHVPKPKIQESSKDKKEGSSESLSKEDSTVESVSSNPCPLVPQQPTIEPASSSQLEQDKAEDIVNSPNLKVENSPIEFKARDACKEFVKGFFAALPIRELQTDIKKGLLGKNSLHQRLQVEFHFTASDACGSE